MPELTPEQKAQLDRNIRNMLSQGASEDDVIAYSKDFRAKYDIPVEKKNLVGNVSASGSGVGGLSTSQSQLQSQGVSERDIAGVKQGGFRLNEVSLSPQAQALVEHDTKTLNKVRNPKLTSYVGTSKEFDDVNLNDDKSISKAIGVLSQPFRYERDEKGVTTKPNPELEKEKQEALGLLQSRLIYNKATKDHDQEVKDLAPKIQEAVIRVNIQRERGENVATGQAIQSDKEAADHFSIGLNYTKDANPAKYKNITRALKEKGRVADSDFEALAETGKMIRQIQGQETNAQYAGTSYQAKKSDAALKIGEWAKQNGKRINDQTIDEAATQLGINPEIAKDIKLEDKLLGYDAVPRHGAIQQFVRGVEKPFVGITESINKWFGQDDSDTYLQSQALDVGVGQKVADEKGVLTEELPSERGNILYDALEGFGQFIPQVLLTRGVGGAVAKGVGTIPKVAMTAAQTNRLINTSGTLASVYMQEYGTSYADALNKTGNPNEAKAMAAINSAAAAGFELFLPDIKIAQQALRGKLGNELIDMIKSGKPLSEIKQEGQSLIRRYVAEVGTITGKEISEELSTNLTNYLTESIFSPETIKDRDLGSELLETAKGTAVQMAIPALIGGAGVRNDFTTQTLNTAALNFDEYKSSLSRLLSNDKITEQEYNQAINILETHRKNLRATEDSELAIEQTVKEVEQPNQGEEVQGSVATEAPIELPTADQQIKLTKNEKEETQEATSQKEEIIPEAPSPVPEGGAVAKAEDKVKDIERRRQEELSQSEIISVPNVIDELVKEGVFTSEQGEYYKRNKLKFVQFTKGELKPFIEKNNSKISDDKYWQVIHKIEELYKSDGEDVRVSKNTKEINSKYDAELAAIEKEKPQQKSVPEGGGEVSNKNSNISTKSEKEYNGTKRELVKELKDRKDDKAVHAEIFQSDGYRVFVYDNEKILVDEKFKTHDEAKKFLDDWSSKNGEENQKKYTYGTITDIANPPYRQEVFGEIPEEVFKQNQGEKSERSVASEAQSEIQKPGTKKPTNEAPIQEADKPNQQSQQQAEETSQQSSQPTENQPPAEPPKGEAAVGGEEGGTGITHAQTAETREKFGFEDYEKKPETFEQWDAKADERIAKGDMPALIKKMQEGKTPSEVEQRMMGKYIAELAKKAEENPSDENLDALHDAIVLSDIVGGREVGKSLVSRKGTFLPDDSLAGFFETERMINKDAPLTEAQKETVKKEWEDLQKAKDAYNAYVFQKESELGAREAQAKIAEEAQATRKKGTRKTDKDFSDERKQIITDIKDKLKKARGETQATILPFAKELIAISPDVAKLVRNLVENGVTKLADIVDRVHDILKEDIEKISKQDVVDLIAGNYNEKKKTRNQLARDLFELRTEAKLINEYDKLQSGIEPKKEKEKVQKNQKLEALRKQIKEHDLTKLSQVKSRLNSEIEKVENQIAKGDFAKPEKKPQIKLDKEGNALRDKLIKLQQQRDARMLLTQRQNEGSKARALRIAAEIFNIPRTLMTIGDFSGLLRQNLFFSVGHPGITAKALPGMFKSFTSQKVYDRWFADLKDTPRYDVIQKSRLAIADSLNHDLSKREEDFMSTLAEKIPVIGRDFDIGKGKIPGLNIVKGSERSYTMLLNKVRVDMFNYFADKMEARGLTVENSPKEYKAMAEYINNATGRSDFGERLNRIAPILNSVFFSPRLIASRVNMLTYWAQPRFWKTLPKEARIDYFRNWSSLLAVGGTIMALAAMAGADVEDDPRSSDFGKIKSGDTRWDIWGGAQPYVRAFAQVATGTRKSTNSGKLYDLDGDDIFGENRMGVMTDFFRNKLAPVPGAAVDVLSGRTSIGDKIVYQWGDAEDKEISIDEYVKQRLLPMTITGTQEAIKQDGWDRLFTVGIPSTFGVGTQAYEKSNTKPKTIKLYQPNGTKTREATPEEYAKYEKERDEIFIKKMDEIEKRGHVWLNKYGELTTSKDDKAKTKPLQDLTKEEKKDLSSRIKTQAGNEAKKKIKF